MSLEPTIGWVGSRNKRECGNRAMRSLQLAKNAAWLAVPNVLGKKEAPSEDGAFIDRAEAKSKVMANDEGGGFAIRRLGIGRGRRIRRQPGCRRSGPREEDSAGSHRQPEYALRPPSQQCAS